MKAIRPSGRKQGSKSSHAPSVNCTKPLPSALHLKDVVAVFRRPLVGLLALVFLPGLGLAVGEEDRRCRRRRLRARETSPASSFWPASGHSRRPSPPAGRPARGCRSKGVFQHEQPPARLGVAAVVLVAHVIHADRIVPLDKQQPVELQQWIVKRNRTLQAGHLLQQLRWHVRRFRQGIRLCSILGQLLHQRLDLLGIGMGRQTVCQLLGAGNQTVQGRAPCAVLAGHRWRYRDNQRQQHGQKKRPSSIQ